MARINSTNSISNALAQPSGKIVASAVVENHRQPPKWEPQDVDEVTMASRRCVKTILGRQVGRDRKLEKDTLAKTSEINSLETADRSDQARHRFTLRQLYSHQSVTVELHLFDPTAPLEREQLQKHARQLQALDCPAIPPYVDAFELETSLGPSFAIVQAAPEAQSIQSWIDDGYCFDEFELMLIALRMLSTLKHLHGETQKSAGCTVHRAIKPSNILLENRRVADPFADYDPARERRRQYKRDRGFGRLYLVNLGRAAVENESGTLTSSGTYGYTAPEQFYGRSQPASDLYSLGATLIYMASGQSPAAWMRPDLEIAPGNIALSRPFIEWISRLTHADLAKRTPSASRALQELELIQLVGKPLAKGDYSMAVPRPQLSLNPQTIHLDFNVNSTPRELKIRCHYDRVVGDKSQKRYTPSGIASPEELKTALLLVLAVTMVGSTVALTGSPFLGFVVALLLPGFYFILVPPTPATEPVERQANVRLRRDACGRIFVTLATTPLPKQKHRRRAIAESAFLESQIHFANVPVRLLCTKPGFFSPRVSFIVATNDPKRTQKISITGSPEDIRWLRVHVGRWLKS